MLLNRNHLFLWIRVFYWHQLERLTARLLSNCHRPHVMLSTSSFTHQPMFRCSLALLLTSSRLPQQSPYFTQNVIRCTSIHLLILPPVLANAKYAYANLLKFKSRDSSYNIRVHGTNSPVCPSRRHTINDYFKMTTINKIFIYDNINIFMMQINRKIPFEQHSCHSSQLIACIAITFCFIIYMLTSKWMGIMRAPQCGQYGYEVHVTMVL